MANEDIKALLANIRDTAYTSCRNGLLLACPKILDVIFEDRDWNDDTYNLRDSFAWVLYEDGKEIGRGYISDQKATKPYVGRGEMRGVTVYGRDEAINFISNYSPRINKGFEALFLAGMWYANYLEWKDLLMGFVNGEDEAQRLSINAIKSNFQPIERYKTR